MVSLRLALILIASSLLADNIELKVVGVTPTQAVVRYSAPDENACTFQLSESSTLSPLVPDVDPALFPDASTDSRPGSISNGRLRTLVLGKRDIGSALNGKKYSRALQAFTTHYLAVTCGQDTGTVDFQTQNPPLGHNAPEAPLFDSGSFGNYAQPTIDFKNQDATYIDPLTGVLLKRATTPGQTGDAAPANMAFTQAVGGAGWVSANSALGSSDFTVYNGSGSPSDSLFLAASLNTGGLKGYSVQNTFLDMRVRLNGSGNSTNAIDRTLSACLTIDHGQTCAGAVIDLPALPRASAAIIQYPSTYPSPILEQWTEAGATPIITPNMQTRRGNVTVSGSTVTLNGGDTFQDMTGGDTIKIPGSGCPGDECVIDAVVNSKRLALRTPAPNTVTADFTADNFGLKIWKKTAAGTIQINGARYDFTYDTNFGMPVAGEYTHCSNMPVVTTISRNGTPLPSPLTGFLCTHQDRYANARLFWMGSNGESRHLSNLIRPLVSSPAADAIGPGSGCAISSGVDPMGNFDMSDANSLYCAGNVTAQKYPVIYKCTYNPNDSTWGNYREWDNGFNFYAENPAVSCVNITKASQGKDLAAQIKALDPSFDSNYFNTIGPGAVKGRYFTLTVKPGQDRIGYYVVFDTVTQRVTQVHSSWNSPPLRWGKIHGGAAHVTPNYGALYVTALNTASAMGIGQYQFTITAIQGRSDASLPATYTDSQTCEQLGVTNAVFIAEGAKGNKCIKVTTTLGDPVNPTPHPTDLAKWPWPHNASSCGGDGTTSNCWSMLQPLMEGDYVADASINPYYATELMRVVKILGPNQFVWQRFANECDLAGDQHLAHGNGWTPMMWPRGVCGASFAFFDNAGKITIDQASMNQSHHDVLTDANSDRGTWIQSGYDIRIGDMAEQLGKSATFHSYGSYAPEFAGSKAAIQAVAIQSHPSARQHAAEMPELRWMLDARPYGGAVGGMAVLFYNVVTPTSTADVYKVGPAMLSPGGTGPAISALDRKKLPLHVWAGRYLLKDKSGPGSVLAATDVWQYCVADFEGECMAGSQAGDVFMNVPQADTSGVCLANFEANTPCWVSASPVAPFVTQVDLTKEDSQGQYWRRVSNYLNGIGWNSNFWNARSLPDGSWAFTDSVWLNGYRTELMMAKLPPWPPDDTTSRGTFIQVPVDVDGSEDRSVRIRFGYDTNLFCTSRLEECSTPSGFPFTWKSEPQTWTTCSGSCKITLPALSGRVLYYVVDTADSNNNITTSDMVAVPIP